jgi:voltage-gated potassium channel
MKIADQIAKLKNHYILCGAGRTGVHIIERFFETQTPFVVIDQSMAVLKDLQENLAETSGELLYIIDDATEDETLEQAGILQAKGLITALEDDKDNLFVTLTARALNPDVRIVARVNDEKFNKGKLEKAGADKVVSTNTIGGLRMASEMIRPEVVDFLDQMVRASEKKKTLRFVELPLIDIKTPELRELIEAHKKAGDRTCELHIRDIGQHTSLLVVAIKSRDEEHSDRQNGDFYPLQKRYRFTPRGDEELCIDDILVVIGTQETLDEVLGK